MDGARNDDGGAGVLSGAEVPLRGMQEDGEGDERRGCRVIHAVDLFCGVGGTSTGIQKACEERLKMPLSLTAVNHWKTAINSHSLNHPGVKHICEPVENLHPMDLVKSGRLDLLAASCECRYHSNARGGGPCNEQSRSQAWQLIRWITDIHVETLMMENVREFMNWGPIHARTKKPIKSKAGTFFKSFINALLNLGYKVEWKLQVAADFGDPTSRMRFMLIAQKNKAVTWPEPSHGPGREQPYRTAREIIDWKLKGKSIFEDMPCENTLRRIAAGLRKFGGPAAEPFLIMLNGTSDGHLNSSAKSVDDPLPTVVASGNHIELIQPFIVNQKGQSDAAEIDKPLPTITAQAQHLYLCEPFVMHLTHQGNDSSRCHSANKPLPTVTCAKRGEMALIEPLIVQTDQTGGNGCYARPVSRPLGTIVSKQNMMLIQPFIVKYYGTSKAGESVDEPLDTVTTKDRFLLVEPTTGRTVAELDILKRLLQPHELMAAHSFPDTYRITGTKGDQTKQIGNSVPVMLAAAHAEAALR